MSSQETPLSARDAALLVLIALIWGVNSASTKYALTHLPPLLGSCIRFAVAGLALIPFWKPAPGALKPLMLIGFVTAAHFVLQSIGVWMAHDLGPMVIAMQLWIPASAILASVFLKERMGAERIAGVAISMAGIVVLALEPSIAAQLPALGLVGLGSVIYGASSVLVRRNPPIHPLAYQAWVSLTGLALIGPLSAAVERDHVQAVIHGGWLAFAALAGAAISSSVFANALMFRLLQKYQVARTTPFMFISPVIGIALGVLFFKDPISAQTLIGAFVVLAGVGVTAFADRIAVSFRR